MAFLDRFHKKTPVKAQPAEKKNAKQAVSAPVVGVSSSLAPAGKHSGLAFRLLTKPHVSEKVGSLSAHGTYVFQVPVSAEKIAIKKAVEALYQVHITAVRTARYGGKPIYRGRRAGARKDWKKAFVTLKKGETIQMYEGV